MLRYKSTETSGSNVSSGMHKFQRRKYLVKFLRQSIEAVASFLPLCTETHLNRPDMQSCQVAIQAPDLHAITLLCCLSKCNQTLQEEGGYKHTLQGCSGTARACDASYLPRPWLDIR